MSVFAVRKLALATALGLGVGMLVSSPASARPLADDHAASAASSAKRAQCKSAVVGVLANGRAVQRYITNDLITDEKTTARALPFRPSGTSFFGYTQVAGGEDDTFIMLDPKGSPRLVTMKVRDASTTMAVSTTKLLNNRFPAKLYTGSGGYFTFTVSKAGVLKRWTTYKNARGKVYFGDPVTIRKGLQNLTTLAFQSRIRIGGKKSDVLYATTKSGAFQQVRVPVAAPTKEKIVTVKGSGFRGTTGLSLSYCNSKASYVSIIAINAKTDSARWYTLSGSTTPRATNLVSQGALANDVSWRLHATL